MFEYAKQRILLDCGFIKKFWWLYVIGILAFLIAVLVKRNKRGSKR